MTEFKKTLIYAVAMFVALQAVYLLTLAPGVVWGDSAKLTLYALQTSPNWDVVGGHPAHTIVSMIIASLLDVDNYAFAINYVSAIFGTFAIVLIFLAVTEITNSRVSAAVAALSLAFSHTFWTFSVVAESYSLVLFFASLVLYLVVLAERKGSILYFAAGFFAALSALANLLFVFALPGYLFISLSRGVRQTLLFVLGGICGFITIAGLLYINYDLSRLLSSFLFASGEYVMPARFLFEFFLSFFYVGFQFPSLALVFFAAYLIRCKKAAIEWGLIIAALGVVIFASTYQYQRHFVFLVMAYFHISVLLGIAMSRVEGLRVLRRYVIPSIIMFPILLYSIVPILLADAKLLQARPLPGRDAAYFYSPWKHTVTKPELWGRQFISKLDVNSVVYADFTIARVLSYLSRMDNVSETFEIVEIDKWIFLKSGAQAYESDICAKLQSGRQVYIAQNYDPYYRTELLKAKFVLLNYDIGFRVVSARDESACIL